jgi:hypothetical protein
LFFFYCSVAISSGIFGYPIHRVATLVFDAIQYFVNKYETTLKRICLTNFDENSVEAFEHELKIRSIKQLKNNNNVSTQTSTSTSTNTSQHQIMEYQNIQQQAIENKKMNETSSIYFGDHDSNEKMEQKE